MSVFQVFLFDSGIYTRRTCGKGLKKDHLPCQASTNRFQSNSKISINLKRYLLQKEFFLKKVVVMPKGKFPRIKVRIL